MSDEDVERLVHREAPNILDSCLPVVQVLGPATRLSISAASADTDAKRVSDNRRSITDEEVAWLGEGG